jgi:predicted nuclease with TOPRIM domain
LREKEAQLEEVEEQLRQLKAERDRLTSQTVARKLEALRAALKRDPLDVVEVNKALRQSVSKIVMHPEDATLQIYWHHAEEPSEPIHFYTRHKLWPPVG